MVGPRSVYEIIATEDLRDLAGVLLEPGALPAFLADRAGLISNQNVPLDWVWSGYTEALRTQMLEGASGKPPSDSGELPCKFPCDEKRPSWMEATSCCGIRVTAVRTRDGSVLNEVVLRELAPLRHHTLSVGQDTGRLSDLMFKWATPILVSDPKSVRS